MKEMSNHEKKKQHKGGIFEKIFNTIVTELSIRLEEVGIPINEARSYARQAIAAYPNDMSMDVFFGYALALHKATTKNE